MKSRDKKRQVRNEIRTLRSHIRLLAAENQELRMRNADLIDHREDVQTVHSALLVPHNANVPYDYIERNLTLKIAESIVKENLMTIEPVMPMRNEFGVIQFYKHSARIRIMKELES